MISKRFIRVNLLAQNSVNCPKPDYRKRIRKKIGIITYFIFHSSWYNFYNIWHKELGETRNLWLRLRMTHLRIKWSFFCIVLWCVFFFYIILRSDQREVMRPSWKNPERVILNQLKPWLVFKMCVKFTVLTFL